MVYLSPSNGPALSWPGPRISAPDLPYVEEPDSLRDGGMDPNTAHGGPGRHTNGLKTVLKCATRLCFCSDGLKFRRWQPIRNRVSESERSDQEIAEFCQQPLPQCTVNGAECSVQCTVIPYSSLRAASDPHRWAGSGARLPDRTVYLGQAGEMQ